MNLLTYYEKCKTLRELREEYKNEISKLHPDKSLLDSLKLEMDSILEELKTEDRSMVNGWTDPQTGNYPSPFKSIFSKDQLKQWAFAIGVVITFTTMFFMCALWLINDHLTMSQFLKQYWWMYIFFIPAALLMHYSESK